MSSRPTTAPSCRRRRCSPAISRRSRHRRATPGARSTSAAPFAGNRVNPALFSKAALNITSKLPTTTDPCGLVQYGLPTATDEWQYVGKVDYQLNTKHSVFGRYIATKQFTPPPFSLRRPRSRICSSPASAAATTWPRRSRPARTSCISSTHVQLACGSRSTARRSTGRAPTSSPRPKSASTSTATCRTTCC